MKKKELFKGNKELKNEIDLLNQSYDNLKEKNEKIVKEAID